MTITPLPRLWLPVLALLLMAILGGCSMLGGDDAQIESAQAAQPQDEPPAEPEQTAEEKREAEEARLAEEKREAEEARVAEEKRVAEEDQRRATAVREAFGPVPESPPVTAAAAAAAATAAADQAALKLIPFDEGVPPLPQEPILRVAVLSEEDQPEKGDMVALTLGTYNRERIEDRLGMAVRIAYVSRLEDTGTVVSAIRFRPSFMKAALVVAAELPHRQEIGPMSSEELRQDSVDLLVYIGPNYR